MTDDSPENLVTRFIELWQQQCAGMVQDPQIIEASLRLMQRMQPFYTGNHHSHAAAVSPDNAQPLSDMPERIRALEERVTILESQLAAAGARAAPKEQTARSRAVKRGAKQPAEAAD